MDGVRRRLHGESLLCLLLTGLLLFFPAVGLGATLEDSMAAGNDQLAAKDYAQAADSFRAAIQADPNFSPAYISLAKALLIQVKEESPDPSLLGESEQALRQALALTPEISEAHGLLGQAALARGSFHEAVAEFEAELRISSRAPVLRAEVYNGIGRAYAGLGRPVEGLRAFRQAISRDPNYAEAMYRIAQTLHANGKYEEAVQELDKLHTLLQDYSFENMRVNRIKERGQRDPDVTEETVHREYYHAAQFLEKEAQWPAIFKLQAKCYHNVGNYEMARVAYLQALKPAYQGNRNDPDVRTAIVRELFTQIDHAIRLEGKIIDGFRALKAADAQLEDILKLDTDFAPAIALQGEMYLLQAERYKVNKELDIIPKTYDEAIETLTKAVTLYERRRSQAGVPEILRSAEMFSAAEYALGRAYLGKGDAASAITHLQKALELDPTNLDARVVQAQAQVKAGQVDVAEAILDEVLQTKPDVVEALVTKAQIAYDAGRYNEAAKLSERATALDPGNSGAEMLSGRAYNARGSWEAARRHFRRAIELIPESLVLTLADELATLHCLLGRAYLNDDRTREAADAFSKALTLNPAYAEAQIGLGDAFAARKDYLGAERAYMVAKDIQEGVSPELRAEMDLALGRLYLKLNKTTEAYGLILNAVRTDPKSTEASEALRRLQDELHGSVPAPPQS